MELLPLLTAAAPARIVNVASLGQHPIDFDDVMIERGYSGSRAYAQSKLAQISSGFELAGRLQPGQVTVNSLHPGTYMPTKIVLSARQPVDTLQTGVDSTVRLAASPELDQVSGRFYDRKQEARAHPQAYDSQARQRLWDLSFKLTAAPPAS
jgi:NAD(P)-dependent dehydrogenase (short-subunit alcohol dehydrogenase family)